MGSTGRRKGTNRGLASLATISNPLIGTQGQHQQMGRKFQQLQWQQQQGGAAVAAASAEPPSQMGGDASASCTEVEARREAAEGVSDNDSEVCDLTLDGALEDETLKKANALTEEEVARRRSRRVKQLMKLYRMHYWGLLEELRSKYRVFYIKHGKGGWRDDVDAEKERPDDAMDCSDGHDKVTKGKLLLDGVGVMKEPLAPDKSASETVRCAYQGCKSKPLALSVFCFSHILLETRQQLYRPCTFVIRSGQNGSVTCGKPVLRSLVPSYCSAHIQKQSSRGMRKANINVAATNPKPGPKLHLVIAEYVRLIQSKRRAARDATLKHVTSTVSVKDSDGAPSSVIQQEQLPVQV